MTALIVALVPSALAVLYTEDAVIMPPNGERLHGREASKGLAASYIEAGAVQIELPPPDAYAVLGETAWIEGTYRFYVPDGSPNGAGQLHPRSRGAGAGRRRLTLPTEPNSLPATPTMNDTLPTWDERFPASLRGVIDDC